MIILAMVTAVLIANLAILLTVGVTKNFENLKRNVAIGGMLAVKFNVIFFLFILASQDHSLMTYALNTILVGAVVAAYLVFDLLWHKIDHSE